ncbi:MAG: ubiquinone/menaquinone biosynthesis C-methylase UbiE [Paraglaciecola sp.]|jgi:ubiquinone/menaquinone biosynthesis C-methylase UbiE
MFEEDTSLNLIYPDLQYRSKQKEQLDNLTLKGNTLYQTLAELATINCFLGNYWAVKKAVFGIVKTGKQQSVHIIDIGCGGGDILLFLAKAFRKKGMQATFLGIDGNANSLALATKNALVFPEIKFEQANLLTADFQLPECDILMGSHFLYHFDNQEVVRFVNKQRPFVKLAFIVSELERNRLAFGLFKLFSPLLGFSKLTREDGLLAIQRAFTKRELVAILKEADFSNLNIRRAFFFRLILKISFVK